MSPSFQAFRCSCHTPSPTRMVSAMSVAIAGTTSERREAGGAGELTARSDPSKREGRPESRPPSRPWTWVASVGCGVMAASAPDVDSGEQEEPHDVDEVPVPGRELEAE